MQIESLDNGEQLSSKSRYRSQFAITSTSDSSPKIEEIKVKQNVFIQNRLESDKVPQLPQPQQQLQNIQDIFAQTGIALANDPNYTNLPIHQQINQFFNQNDNFSVQEIQYCKRHSVQFSPSLSHKSISNNRSSIINNNDRNAKSIGDDIDLSKDAFKNFNSGKCKNINKESNGNKNKNYQNNENKAQMNNTNNVIATMSESQQNQDNTENSSNADSSESDSSSEGYIHQCQSKQVSLTRKKNISSDSTSTSINQQSSQSSQVHQSQQQSQQYPLQFICVEMNCTEQSKYCCLKCLSSGGHENHKAICVKTINHQIKSQLTMNKLSSVKLKIDTLFDSLQEKVKECRETLNSQFNTAFIELQNETEYALHPSAPLEKKVQIWKAYYQSENAIIMEHLNFILEKSDLFFNQIGSRIVNLNPKQLLHIKQHTKDDILFYQQLKSIEDELQRAEQNLSLRAKQALAALPQFSFSNKELENSDAVALKKFEFPERIEFCQIDKRGEQYGRCMIFWRDGAYRVGYHKGGQSQGTCRMIWENGNVYEGSYVDDRKEGSGFFIKYSDNTSYFGSFERDAKNGFGIEYYRNNTHYVGEFKNWKTCGKGKLIDTITKKTIQEGNWKQGKFIGEISEL